MNVTAAFGGRAPSENREAVTDSSIAETSMGTLTSSGLPSGDITCGAPNFKRGVCAKAIPWKIEDASKTTKTFVNVLFAMERLPVWFCILPDKKIRSLLIMPRAGTVSSD
jgi:hypothetical protein